MTNYKWLDDPEQKADPMKWVRRFSLAILILLLLGGALYLLVWGLGTADPDMKMKRPSLPDSKTTAHVLVDPDAVKAVEARMNVPASQPAFIARPAWWTEAAIDQAGRLKLAAL
ncbi:MAG: hypothetical protein COY40_02400 [Alphaproteobacteria bacterium CG_4_10_14_0_8_um_filter_53_9]|nr:MAG: hypothetical protein COY40_02400 [Alphaproteobacteria bacterium CG_4_10_14_0_8_um_filter_53_9]